jgi:hypothetical protein
MPLINTLTPASVRRHRLPFTATKNAGIAGLDLETSDPTTRQLDVSFNAKLGNRRTTYTGRRSSQPQPGL